MATKDLRGENIIDSRDVIARISDLEGDEEVAKECETCEGETKREDGTCPACFPDDDQEELAALRALQEEAEGYAPDWKYGTALIRDDYFETYAEELADDIGAIDRNAGWPACHIDWEAAAASLQMDYSAVEFDGVTYWVR